MRSILLCTVLLINGCATSNNRTVQYLDNIEIQYESSIQKKEIILALNDCLKLDKQALQKKRYADHKGRKNAWFLHELFSHYMVPDKQNKKPGNDFYAEITSQEAKTRIKKIIINLKAKLITNSP